MGTSFAGILDPGRRPAAVSTVRIRLDPIICFDAGPR
jgi:hypothetical protein